MLSNAQKDILRQLGNEAFTYGQLREAFTDKPRFKVSLNILIRDGYVIQDFISGRTLYFASQYGRNLAKLIDEIAVLEEHLAQHENRPT